MKIGFVGLGLLGNAIAQKIVKTNIAPLMIWRPKFSNAGNLDANAKNLNPGLISDGAAPVRTVDQIIQSCEMVCSCLPDDTALIDFTNNALNNRDSKLRIHVSFATVSPSAALTVKRSHDARKIEFYNCPVIGRSDAVLLGNGIVLRSGGPKYEEEVDRVLGSVFMKVIDLAEDVEAASLFKLTINFIVASLIGTLSEVADAYEGNEERKEKLKDILVNSPIASPILNAYGEAILFDAIGETNFKLCHGLKDLYLFREAFSRPGSDIAVTNSLISKFEWAVESGLGDNDWTDLRKNFSGNTTKI